MPKEDQVWCATDEVMWSGDECAAEIKKSYSKKKDPGDCTAHFSAASGRCKNTAAGKLDLDECMRALAAMHDGFECYVTRLARDSASGFTSYDNDTMLGGLATFEDEYNGCVSGGWLQNLEKQAKASGRSDVTDWLVNVHTSYRRLLAIAAFGCEDVEFE